MTRPYSVRPWWSRREFLKSSVAVAAGAYGLSPSFAMAGPVPENFDGSSFKLKAPEPHAKSGGVLRHGMPLFRCGRDGVRVLAQRRADLCRLRTTSRFPEDRIMAPLRPDSSSDGAKAAPVPPPSSSPASAPARWSPHFLFRVGPRSAPIGTPTSGVLADDFSDLLLFWPGSRFGADSQAAPMGVAAAVRRRRLAVVDRELDCGEDQGEQDRDDRCRDRVDVHLRASPLGAPSWPELSAAPPDAFRVLPAATFQLPSIAWRGRRESL